jgi:hypothetical protein
MKLTIPLLSSVALLSLVACEPAANPPQPVDPALVETFLVDVPGTSFPVRTALQLKAWGLTAGGKKIDLTAQTTWTTHDAAVARVGPSGILQLDGTGMARLEARYGGFTVPISLEATAARLVQLTLTSEAEGPLPLGEARRFRARAWFDDGSSLDVTQLASWQSDGRAFDASDVKGQIVARAEGVGQLRASYFDQQSSALVTVGPARFRGLSVSAPGVAIKPGDMHRLSLFATYSDGTRRDVSEEAAWSSSNVDVLDVSMQSEHRGELFAGGVGQARITAQWNESVAQLELSVLPREVVRVGFDASQAQVALGRQTGMDLLAELDDGTRVVVTGSASFFSSDPAVAQVSNGDQRGVVTAVGQGLATITAWYQGFESTYEVIVQQPELEALSTTLSGGRLAIGQTAELLLTGVFSDGTVLNLSPVVTPVHGPGLVSGVAQGKLRLTGAQLGVANVDFQVGALAHQVSFEVSAVELQWVTIEDAEPRLPWGPQLQQPLRLRAMGTWADGLRAEITELCSWGVEDASVVVVSNEPGTRGQIDLAAGGSTNVSLLIAGNITTQGWTFPARP